MLRDYWTAHTQLTLVALTQADLDNFCASHPDCDSLRILGNVRGYRTVDFSILSTLPSLTHLAMEDALTNEQITQVCNNTKLVGLSLSHTGKLSNLEPIAKLKNTLEVLALSTPTGWIGKKQHFQTISPIDMLDNLVCLYIVGVTFDDNNFEPLKKLKNLKDVYASKKYLELFANLGII